MGIGTYGNNAYFNLPQHTKQIANELQTKRKL
jgi:hypothetical protein